MSTPIRVLLIENLTLVRLGIVAAFKTATEITVAGEAATGAEGLKLFAEIAPDAVILSLRLPDSCAVDSLDAYFALDKQAKILVTADQAGDAETGRALKKGALGFVCKDVTADELIAAVRTVAAGKKFIPANIAAMLSENIGQEELTQAEKNVLRFVVKGLSNKQIALAVKVSENTVKTHVKNIFDKLQVTDRTAAATVAIKRGLVRIDN